MSKVTLETTAQLLENRLLASPECAALVRAAARVVEAARESVAEHRSSFKRIVLREKLAAFNQLTGEGEKL